MPYQTGIANSASDLVTTIESFATSNGWTKTGNVLHSSTCFVELSSDNSVNQVMCKGGTGIDASNSLTGGGADVYGRMRDINPKQITYPVTYHLFAHTQPETIICVINYDTIYFQYLAFGIATNLGVPGTCNFVSGSISKNGLSNIYHKYNEGGEWGYSSAAAMFWNKTGLSYGNFRGSFIHVNLDGVDWAGTTSQRAMVSAYTPKLLQRQPNAINNRSVFIPLNILFDRPSSKISLIARIEHCRCLRIDYYDPGDIVTIGQTKWKVFPWYKKDVSNRDGGTNHSGTSGWAILYDGP